MAFAIMDRPAQQRGRYQAPINPTQNKLLSDVVAADLLSNLPAGSKTTPGSPVAAVLLAC